MAAISVIVADDEPVITRGLRRLVDWGAMGCELVGSANSGTETLALLARAHPDILVSDVCMPGCSGIDVLREIAERRLPTRVVFISGHREFDYVRDALAYGAIDYVLKPFSPDELKRAVERAIASVRRERGEVAQDERPDDALFNRILDGQPLAQGGEGLRSACRLDDKDLHIAVALFDISALLSRPRSRLREQNRLLAEGLLVEARFRCGDANGAFLRDELLAVTAGGRDAEECRRRLSTVTSRVGELPSTREGAVSVAASGPRPVTVEGFRKAFQDALDGLTTAARVGTAAPAESGAPTAKGAPAGDRAPEEPVEDLLARAILAQDLTAAAALAAGRLDRERRDSCADRESGVSLCLTMISEISHRIASMGVESGAGRGWREHFAAAAHGESYGELREVMESTIETSIALLRGRQRGTQRSEIVKLREFVSTHRGEQCTLERAGRLLGMNPSYVSSLFKKETGENFKEYVMRERMREAMKMLVTTDARIYEVSDALGFSEPGAFSAAFKRYFGRAPAEVKRPIASRS